MSKPKFNERRIEILIRKSFPKAKIKKYEQFSTGLVSPTFKVKITAPNRILVVKLGKLKNKKKIHQNNKILNYLNKSHIPAPKVILENIFDRKFITIMEYSPGNVASKTYGKGNQVLRRKILCNAGKNLRKIHTLKIPPFWIHQHHEIKHQKEWKKWTRLRIDKYLGFFREKLAEYYSFIDINLNEFWNVLKNEKIDFVPLHWDYHLSNLNVNKKGGITGIFDFDNAMKGHSLGDIGQTAYWIRFKVNDSKNFESFLKGYKRQFTKKEMKLIKGYFLLHLLAVSRTIWFKQNRLGWIIDEHKLILDEFRRKGF
ncbi:MAG: aminoglycoside phosphotransferase family protein [Candidatus Nanoarchaeia archaeon]|nr:aminoglycoside phosphotransferase family protein [Candidatus Nanoarchaeia archaeon]